jgi:small conductance mechanosensitive channel
MSIYHVSSDLLNNVKTRTYDEINLFKVDFEVVIHKIYKLIHVFLESLPNMVIAIIIFSFCMLLGRFFHGVINRRQHLPRSVGIVLERLNRITFMLVGIFLALAIIFPSIKPIDLLGGVGVVSLALGFAVKDMLNNFMSGILILLQQPFRVGDEIKHKDLEGIVDYINIRYTVLIGFDGRKFLIPNGEIYANIIVVNTLSNCRWSSFEINVDVSNDFEKISELILAAFQKIEGVMKKPAPSVTLSNLSTNGMTVKCSWTTSPYNSQISTVKSEVLKQIKKVLNLNKISSPLSLEMFTQTLSFIPKTIDEDQKVGSAS